MNRLLEITGGQDSTARTAISSSIRGSQERAFVVTHAHSDHARRDCGRYLWQVRAQGCCAPQAGRHAQIRALPFGETLTINGVRASSPGWAYPRLCPDTRRAQRRSLVVSGDYKTEPDPTCTPELRRHTFITEATFGLLHLPLAPSQRLSRSTIGGAPTRRFSGSVRPLRLCVGQSAAVAGFTSTAASAPSSPTAPERLNADYRAAGIDLPETVSAFDVFTKTDWLAHWRRRPPPTARPGCAAFGDISTGFASGWMQVLRGQRRRRSIGPWVIPPDHVDWPALMQTIHSTGAERAGDAWLHRRGGTISTRTGIDAYPLSTRFTGEADTGDDEEE
ncbi:MAG: hypothetical protein R2856_34220 [Caldilineaceae bacterium]